MKLVEMQMRLTELPVRRLPMLLRTPDKKTGSPILGIESINTKLVGWERYQKGTFPMRLRVDPTTHLRDACAF